MGIILKRNFFNQDTEKVAFKLLGSLLVRRMGKQVIKSEIIEIEIYDGHKDRASHASRGMTKRNQVMYGEAGRFYIYFTCGIHWMLNIVTREKGYPAAILIRGLKPVQTWLAQGDVELNGPAKLTKALKIDGRLNGKSANQSNGLWFEKGSPTKKNQVEKLPRVGVAYAGPYWSRRKRRFRAKRIAHPEDGLGK